MCCDGSDEAGLSASNPTAPKCENKCKQLNALYVAEKNRLAEIRAAGLKTRDQLVAKARTLKEALVADLAKTEEKVNALDSKIMANEAKLEVLLAAGGGKSTGELPEEIGKARDQVYELEQQYAGALEVITKLKADIKAYEVLLQTMKTEYNVNFNDPAVKTAVRLFEELQANEDASSLDQKITQITEEKVKFGNVVSSLADYKAAPCASPAAASILPFWAQEQLGSLKLWLIENGILADSEFDPMGTATPSSSSSNSNSAETTYLTNLITKHKAELTKLKSQIDDLRNDINGDYGHDDVLRSLKNTCISDPLGEYTYEFCFSGHANQKGKGANTNLGKFANLKYSADGQAMTLNFEKGAKCWSGPIRRASVELTCGREHKIFLVSEPERCEYFFKGTSPVACKREEEKVGGSLVGDNDGTRDEL